MPPDHPARDAAPSTSAPSGRLNVLLALALLLGLVIWIRLGLASTPLERDEGEYALVGQLMRQGIPPYAEAANMKFPGTYAMNALLLSLFGETAEGVHHGLLAVNLLTILLLYRFALRLFADRITAWLSAAFYGFATLSFTFLGPMAHATHFVVCFGLAGLLLLSPPVLSGSHSRFMLILAGLAMGSACLCKQSGIFFVPAGALLILSAQGWRWSAPSVWRSLAWYLAGAFAPFALMVAWLDRQGVLANFVFWTFQYASTYGPSLAKAPGILAQQFQQMADSTWGWLIFIPAGLAFLPVFRRNLALPVAVPGLLTGLGVLSLGGVSLGLYFRPHYWIQALPVLALLAAVTSHGLAAWAGQRWRLQPRSVHLLAGGLCLAYGGAVLAGEHRLLFPRDPADNIPAIYGGQPFREARQIADFIRQNSAPEDRVFVFGCEPEIYFYARRRPSVNNLYVCYNLLQPHRLQEVLFRKLAADFDRQPPRYFVEADVQYFITEESRRSPLYQWRTRMLRDHYHPVHMLDLYLEGPDTIAPAAIPTHVSQSGCYLTVWERNDAPRATP